MAKWSAFGQFAGKDEKYWDEKMEEFYKEFKEQIDSLAQSWFLDLSKYKFISFYKKRMVCRLSGFPD